VVAEIYHDLGASGVVIEDPELLNNYIDAGQWDFSGIERAEDTSIVTVKAYLPVDEDLDDKLRTFELRIKDFKSMTDDDMEKGPCTISWNTVRDEDWADNWKAYFHPEKVGGMLVIKPTWEDYEASPDDIVIELDPGSAFGTGTHPTTAMCLRELETLVKGGMRIFDVGTGSGVLSIAAAKLGATDVTAMDYDKVAVDVAAENIRQNGVEDVVKTGVSDILKSFDGKADLIVANIIADIIIMLFDELDEHLAEGGRLLASGIISERLADVTEACLAHGFVVDKVTEEKGWVAMTISRGENK
jgi:ribosomal protein L11 methyltransferase